ncbi:MAG: TonB family protein [Alphaproteobacteria bacterium]|nr:TonB family protein [Alphaproteobacteria bacterium]
MQQPEHDLRAFQTSVASPRRYVSLILVGALHVAAIYALASGLAARMVPKPLEDIMAEVVKEKPPEEEKAPPPPPPDLQKPPPPFVPPPDINIQVDTGPTNAITVQSTQQVKAPPPSMATGPKATGRKHDCYSGYPPVSKRLGEEGTVLVKFTITASGDVTNASVAQSSGKDRLDAAALECVGSWRYKPALTADGTPIESSLTSKIVYKLTGG